MNFTESFEQFSSKLTTMDLALYAGVGMVLWVLFKDKLSPVQELILSLFKNVKGSLETKPSSSLVPVTVPVVTETKSVNEQKDTFFKLIVSWKQTRDLAVQSGCPEAVKVADEMFPFLSPSVCEKKDVV
jgi:hypothetical protein